MDIVFFGGLSDVFARVALILLCVLTAPVSFICITRFASVRQESEKQGNRHALLVELGCAALRGPSCDGRNSGSELADTCGTFKRFVAVATISTDAFRFSAIR
jgi:hypothetical protein